MERCVQVILGDPKRELPRPRNKCRRQGEKLMRGFRLFRKDTLPIPSGSGAHGCRRRI